jgi:hypothetical protein
LFDITLLTRSLSNVWQFDIFSICMIADRQDDGRYIFSLFRFEARSAVEAIEDSEETGGILFFPFWRTVVN